MWTSPKIALVTGTPGPGAATAARPAVAGASVLACGIDEAAMRPSIDLRGIAVSL